MVHERGVGPPVEVYATEEFLCCVQWSHDSSQLLFRTGQRRSGSTLILDRFGGATARRINTEPISVWSPDDSQVVSWWPQARVLWFTDLSTGDSTRAVRFEIEYDWLCGISWSPKNDLLAVITETGPGAYAIWVIGVESGNERLVLEDSLPIQSPHWSPAADALYYLRDDNGSQSLWKLRVGDDGTALGSATRILSGLAVQVRNIAIPAFSLSAAGTLLYTKVVSYSNIWLFEVSESGEILSQHELTAGTAVRSFPRFSPDGSRVAYVESAGAASNLFTIPVDGGEASQVTFVDGQVWSPAWSPDGSEIAFGAESQDTAHVRVVNAGGGPARVYDRSRFQRDDDLAWAPARHILYQEPGHQNLRVLDPATAEDRPLLSSDTLGWFYDLRSSPDGGRVALRVSRGALWIVSLDGSRQVTQDAPLAPVGWKAAGDAVYAMSTSWRQEVAQEILLVPLAGGRPTRYAVLPFEVHPQHVSVSPDGRRIVAAVFNSYTDAWAVEGFDPGLR